MTADHCSEPDGQQIVRAARRWIGTPYMHQASCMGIGADCLGLVRGVWRDVVGPEPEKLPAYTPDWSEAGGQERLLDAAARHLTEIPVSSAAPGDMLVFRMLHAGPAKHAAIMVSSRAGYCRIIHAYSGHDVCETALSASWRRRIVAAFRFPHLPVKQSEAA